MLVVESEQQKWISLVFAVTISHSQGPPHKLFLNVSGGSTSIVSSKQSTQVSTPGTSISPSSTDVSDFKALSGIYAKNFCSSDPEAPGIGVVPEGEQ